MVMDVVQLGAGEEGVCVCNWDAEDKDKNKRRFKFVQLWS